MDPYKSSDGIDRRLLVRGSYSPDLLFQSADEATYGMTSSLECIFSWTDIVRWITRIRIWPVIIAVTWEVEFWFWIRMFIIIQTTKFCFRIQYWNVEFFHRISLHLSVCIDSDEMHFFYFWNKQSQAELQHWHKGFIKDCPTGKLTSEEFGIIYRDVSHNMCNWV